jgi:hypothetical protein
MTDLPQGRSVTQDDTPGKLYDRRAMTRTIALVVVVAAALTGCALGSVGSETATPRSFGDLPLSERMQSIAGVWDGYVGKRFATYVIWSVTEESGSWYATLEHESNVGKRFRQRATVVGDTIVLGPWVGLGNDTIRMTFQDARTMSATFTIGSTTTPGLFKKTSAVTSVGPPSSRTTPVPTPPPVMQPYPNSWALVIGIDTYPNALPPRREATAGARAVAAALPELGFPPDNVRVLLGGEATRTKIETILYRDFARMGPDDRLLVYFAGHAETVAIRGGEEGYILPVDADPNTLPLTAIPLGEIKRLTQRLPAKHYLFVVDACVSGLALTRETTTVVTSDEYITSALREPVVQVITAGRKGERAIEGAGIGLFTRLFLDGLRGHADADGRGVTTAAQLAAWLESRVIHDSFGRMTPQYTKLDGEGQFVFVRAPRP